MRARLLLASTLLASAALLALAPSAAAHSEAVAQGRALEMPPFTAYLNPDPPVLYANTSNQAFTLQVTRADVGGFATDVQAKMRIQGPGGLDENLSFRRVNSQYLIATTTLPHRGNHSVEVVILDAEGERHAATTDLEVYPDLPFRLRPVDPTLDVVPDTRTTLAYETLHPITLDRIDAFDTLTVRIEHWSPDHGTLLETTDVAATRAGVGLWRITHVFPQGHYYLRFASEDGGFNYADLPLLHTNVYPPTGGTQSDEERESPGIPLAALLAALGAAAMLKAASRVRRR